MASEIEGFEYICNVNTIFEYMQKEIEFAINNKLELVTEFIIKYKRKKYNVNIWNNTDYSKNESKNDIDIMLNEEHYKTLEDFKNNTQLNGILIKDIKENIKVILTHHDSSYLEEHQVKENKPINTKAKTKRLNELYNIKNVMDLFADVENTKNYYLHRSCCDNKCFVRSCCGFQ